MVDAQTRASQNIAPVDATLGLLAEYASVSMNGKLNVLGIFDQISSATFPTGIPILYVVVSFSVGAAEFNIEKTVQIILHDADNTELLRSEQSAKVPKPALAGIRGTLNVVSGFAGLGFMAPGMFQFSAVVDGRTEKTIPLYVTQIK